MTAEQAAQYLGITKQSVLNMAHAGKLLSWRAEKQGAFRFPAWQFHDGGRLPGLENVLSALGKESGLDDWGRIGFFLQNHALLNNRRPLDLLRSNKPELVLTAAAAYVE
jgi:excisionase family DNA binding protein